MYPEQGWTAAWPTCTSVHTGTYRATPSRRVSLPKPDGGTRPLGIAALEDKIVQKTDDGEWRDELRGTPQGALISPH